MSNNYFNFQQKNGPKFGKCNMNSKEFYSRRSVTVKNMKRNKSSGIDNLCFLTDSTAFIMLFLVTVFDNIFETGVYPESWTEVMILSILKKAF